MQMRNLVYPTQRVINPTAPVSFDISFSGMNKGDILFAGIEDFDFRRFADGTVLGTLDACLPRPEKSSSTAFCGWRLNTTSGSEHVIFQLQISTHARIYDLGATIGLLTSAGDLIPDSLSTNGSSLKVGPYLR
jgi:hypothetical protein